MRTQVLCFQLFLEYYNSGWCLSDLVAHRGMVAFRGLVDAEIINLHPEVKLLVTLVTDRRGRVRAHTRPDVRVPNDKISATDLARRNKVHFIGQDQRRCGQFFIVIGRHIKSSSIDPDMVRIILILDGYIKTVEPW